MEFFHKIDLLFGLFLIDDQSLAKQLDPLLQNITGLEADAHSEEILEFSVHWIGHARIGAHFETVQRELIELGAIHLLRQLNPDEVSTIWFDERTARWEVLPQSLARYLHPGLKR